jgi:hypothetical protein
MPHRPIDSSERMWSIPGDEELATFEAKKNTVLVRGRALYWCYDIFKTPLLGFAWATPLVTGPLRTPNLFTILVQV